MNSKLNFNFNVDQTTHTVHVSKTFAADLNSVWEAFTKPERLDKWWAPKPWLARTKSIDFTVGGRRLYAMIGPEGEEHWALADFTSISPQTNFQYLDAFCDPEGNISKEMPRSTWSLNFEAKGANTNVNIAIKHQSMEDLTKIIEMGFREGFTMALSNLDEILTSNQL